jgi:hypothetical protein
VEVNVDDEDAALAKLDQVVGYDLSADHPCVLKLLDKQRAGLLLWCGKQQRWQSRALFTFTKKPEKATECRRQHYILKTIEWTSPVNGCQNVLEPLMGLPSMVKAYVTLI